MSDLSNSLTKIKALCSAYETAVEEASKQLKEQLHKTVVGLFTDNIEAVVWTQYTPYFNDGDTCYFSVNEPNVILKDPGELTSEDYPVEGCIESWAIKDGHPDKKAIDAIEDLIGSIDKNLMEKAFDDHVIVRIDRDGLTVEEWQHD